MFQTRRLIVAVTITLALLPMATAVQGGTPQSASERPSRLHATIDLRPLIRQGCPGRFQLDAVFRRPSPQGPYTQVVLDFGPGGRLVNELVGTDPMLIYEDTAKRLDGSLVVFPPAPNATSAEGLWIEARNGSLSRDEIRGWLDPIVNDPTGATRSTQPMRRALRRRDGCLFDATITPQDGTGADLGITFDTWDRTGDEAATPPQPPADVGGSSPVVWQASEDGTAWVVHSVQDSWAVRRLAAGRRADELQQVPSPAPFYRFETPDGNEVAPAWFVRSVDTASLPIDHARGTPVVLQGFRAPDGTWSWPRQWTWTPSAGDAAEADLIFETALQELRTAVESGADRTLPEAPEDTWLTGTATSSAGDLVDPSFRAFLGTELAAGHTIVAGELTGPGDLYGFTGGLFVGQDPEPPSEALVGVPVDWTVQLDALEGFGGDATGLTAVMLTFSAGPSGWDPQPAPPVEAVGDGWRVTFVCPAMGTLAVLEQVHVESAGANLSLLDQPAMSGLAGGATTDVYLPVFFDCP